MFYTQQRLLSLCPENRSATITCCCFCRVPGGQVVGAEALLALGDASLLLVGVYGSTHSAIFKELVWSMFGDPDLSLLANGKFWYLSLKDKTSLTLGVVAWCDPCNFRENSFLSDKPAGALGGMGQFICIRPPLFQDGLGKQHLGRRCFLLTVCTPIKTRILSVLCH